MIKLELTRDEYNILQDALAEFVLNFPDDNVGDLLDKLTRTSVQHYFSGESDV